MVVSRRSRPSTGLVDVCITDSAGNGLADHPVEGQGYDCEQQRVNEEDEDHVHLITVLDAGGSPGNRPGRAARIRGSRGPRTV